MADLDAMRRLIKAGNALRRWRRILDGTDELDAAALELEEQAWQQAADRWLEELRRVQN